MKRSNEKRHIKSIKSIELEFEESKYGKFPLNEKLLIN
jgi:hypothetical protein